jgi:hypothetical protein
VQANLQCTIALFDATGADNLQWPSRAGWLLLHWCRPWPWVSLSGGEPWEELTRFRMDGSRGTATPITRFEHPSINPSGVARRPPVMMQEHVWSWWPVFGLLVDHLPKFWCRDLCLPPTGCQATTQHLDCGS